ncbi:tyrosine-protein phosphatase [Anaerorhabdus furcosa]|uniref:protein-tyrosine-phosphatase n=1 Tax=Anaerorhabdus furcosa TaxID=118967 RepID=A0A1T4NDQ5_9FIRM|nr:CpsB/CapC family capsule biosynthesis tyrosine phosphatase [Anaerorhabdus furcosa]SJZ77392.1 protein-tyrosine phosphatase [Anaerorhabdus furcosa]
MIDIHTHLIPNIDDGCKSIEESRELLLDAVKMEITDIICTPHFIENGNYKFEYKMTQVLFDHFQDQILDIPITVHLGNEIYYNNQSLVDMLENKVVHTLAGSAYYLFELNFTSFNKDIIGEMYDSNISGYHPILAHPERYKFIQEKIDIVNDFIKEGCYIQVNASSILGYNGRDAKKTAITLLENNLVHIISSDAHSKNRRIDLDEAYDFVLDSYGKDIADLLMSDNPKRIIMNQKLLSTNLEIKKKSVFSIFRK